MIAYEFGAVPRVFIGPGAVKGLPKSVGGWITLSEEPGVGIELDKDVLERTLSHQATFV